MVLDHRIDAHHTRSCLHSQAPTNNDTTMPNSCHSDVALNGLAHLHLLRRHQSKLHRELPRVVGEDRRVDEPVGNHGRSELLQQLLHRQGEEKILRGHHGELDAGKGTDETQEGKGAKKNHLRALEPKWPGTQGRQVGVEVASKQNRLGALECTHARVLAWRVCCITACTRDAPQALHVRALLA